MRLTKLVLLLIGAAAVAVGCKKTVNTKDFEARIKTRVEQLGLTPGKISCPKGVEAKQGSTFTCSVEVGGKLHDLDVTVNSVEGKKLGLETKWHEGDAVQVAKLKAVLVERAQANLGVPVTVDCGSESLAFLGPDRVFTCDATAGGAKTKVTISFDDKTNITGIKTDPQILAKDKLEQILLPAVRAKTAPTVAISCGDQKLLNIPADGIVWCQVTDGDKHAKLKATVDDQANVKAWEIVTE